MKAFVLALGTAAACAAISTPATAATVAREDLTLAAGACQPSVSTTAFRAYGTSVRNVGSTNIYVTCALPADPYGGSNGGNTLVYMRVANVNGTARAMNCTMVAGYTTDTTVGSTTQGSFAKSTTVSANSYNGLEWDPATLLGSGMLFANVAVTCLLQPYTEIKYIGRQYTVEIGT